MIRKCVIHQWMNRATGGAFGYPIFNPWLVLSSQVVEIIPLHMGSAQNLPWDALPWIDGSRIHHHPMGIQAVSEHLDALGICIVLKCIRLLLSTILKLHKSTPTPSNHCTSNSSNFLGGSQRLSKFYLSFRLLAASNASCRDLWICGETFCSVGLRPLSAWPKVENRCITQKLGEFVEVVAGFISSSSSSGYGSVFQLWCFKTCYKKPPMFVFFLGILTCGSLHSCEFRSRNSGSNFWMIVVLKSKNQHLSGGNDFKGHKAWKKLLDEIRPMGNIEAGWRCRFSSGIYRNNPSQSSHLRLDPGSIPSSKRATRAFLKLPKSPVVTPKKMAPTRCCTRAPILVVVGHPIFLE